MYGIRKKENDANPIDNAFESENVAFYISYKNCERSKGNPLQQEPWSTVIFKTK